MIDIPVTIPKRIYAFDFDGTLVSLSKEYKNAKPLKNRIKKVNKLFDEGNIIQIYTARGGTTGLDWRKLTEEQLKKFGIKYHFLVMNKLHYDLLVCDRATNSEVYFNDTDNSS